MLWVLELYGHVGSAWDYRVTLITSHSFSYIYLSQDRSGLSFQDQIADKSLAYLLVSWEISQQHRMLIHSMVWAFINP